MKLGQCMCQARSMCSVSVGALREVSFSLEKTLRHN